VIWRINQKRGAGPPLYYIDTVGKNENRIAEYVRNQLKEDAMGDQPTAVIV